MKIKLLVEVFFVFFKIGTFTVGGGYAMLPLIEKEAVTKKGWISKEEFVDMMALAQSSPGPIAVNASIFVGYRVAGILGSIVAVFGAIMTSFLTLLIIAMFFVGIKDNAVVEHVFKGIRPAVVALIAAPVIRMGKNEKINRYTIAIPILTVIFVAFLGISPILVIIFAIVSGRVYGKKIKKWVEKRWIA